MSARKPNKPALKLYHAEVLAAQFLAKIGEGVYRSEICGSIRRRKPECGDIELVVVPKYKQVTADLFGTPKQVSLLEQYFSINRKYLEVEGERYKKLLIPFAGTEFEDFYPSGSYYQVDLFITKITDLGRQIAIRTGSSFYSKVEIAAAWSRLGWKGTPDGLRRKEQMIENEKGKLIINPALAKDAIIKPPSFPTERDFYAFLGKVWIAPEKRNWEEQ
jgi:DNA polymerase/3'-5' exonuclease PolX